jgi:predicted nucleic acid-binding protein
MEDRNAPLPSLYLETTIVSYAAARPSNDPLIREHQKLTRRWWQEKRHSYRVFASQAVVEEAEGGDASAAEERLRLLAEVSLLPPDPRIESLATTVRRALHIPEKAVSDALHLAFAVHYRLDYLLTWNCAHLANAQNLRSLADLCRAEGLWQPIICTPEEMTEWEGEV